MKIKENSKVARQKENGRPNFIKNEMLVSKNPGKFDDLKLFKNRHLENYLQNEVWENYFQNLKEMRK